LRKKGIFIAAFLMVIILGGCSTKDKDNIDDQILPQEESMNENEKQAGDNNLEDEKPEEDEKFLAPDFTLQNLKGEEVSLSDFKGKYILINFWGTWCKWCDVEMPSLDKLNNENDDLVVLAVNVMEDESKVKEYIENGEYEFEVVLDEEGEVAQVYYVNSFPTSIFVDKEGYLIGGVPAMLEYEQMVEIMDGIRTD
jgi:thiol-disulfide isomerase/thioredoxin